MLNVHSSGSMSVVARLTRSLVGVREEETMKHRLLARVLILASSSHNGRVSRGEQPEYGKKKRHCR